jgi:homoserine kinase type II
MSVHTPLTTLDVEQLLSHYAIGNYVKHQGILAGVTNTNYWLNTTKGQFVITLFEQDSPDRLDFFLQLMRFLATHGLACPQTINDKQQRLQHCLHNKPVAIIEFLPGDTQTIVTAKQCFAIGKATAELHATTARFSVACPANLRGHLWHQQSIVRLHDVLTPTDKELLTHEWEFIQRQSWEHLPQGIIHADLFRDNVLFLEDTITGLIDFYYACQHYLLMDLAVIINDWCVTAGKQDDALYDAVLAGYQTVRRLSPQEKQHLTSMRRASALRFWLSRLLDLHFTADDPLIHKKDPDQCKQLLLMLSK